MLRVMRRSREYQFNSICFSPARSPNPRSITLETNTLTITAPMTHVVLINEYSICTRLISSDNIFVWRWKELKYQSVCDISSTVTTRDSGSIKQIPKNKSEQHEPSILELNIDGCVAAIFIGGGTRVPRENHRPVSCHGRTLSHNVVSSTHRHERGSNSQIQW